MAQTKPKAAQFYGVPGNGTAGQVLISDGNGGMSWGSNTELFTISWNTPTGQGLTYTQPSPQSSEGTAGSAFPTTTFTVTKSDTIISGTATIAGLPTGITATQVITGSGIGNTLTVTLSGVFPGTDSLNTDLTLSGLTLSKTVSWATPTGQSLTYTQPSPQSSTGNPGTAFPTTTFTATKSGEVISGTATITGLPTGITATQSLSGSGANNVLTVTLTGVFPGADSLNTDLTISGLTLAPPLTVDYLVVAGGGGGGRYDGGAGGAGGLRTSYTNSSSLNGHNETALNLLSATNYTVTVGAGGNAGTSGTNNATNGANSVFSTITSTGGGWGGVRGAAGGTNVPNTGGCGGGGASINNINNVGAAAVTSPVTQGYAGGNGIDGGSYQAGGGGGANGVGSSAGGAGGAGLEVNIIGGTGNYYSGGGGGGSDSGPTNNGATGGGGNGGRINVNATSGTPNTGGGGGGGGGGPSSLPASGGSGVVIVRYSNAYTVSIGAGLTGSTTTVGTDKVTTLTAGTGNIQFN